MSNVALKEYRCDDAAGFELHVLQAYDGDLHLSVVPNNADFARERGNETLEQYAPCYSASVRIRMPMIGGGSHPQLYHVLNSLFHDEPAMVVYKKEALWLAERRIKWEDSPDPILRWKLANVGNF